MPKTSQKTILDSQSRELVIRLRDYFERERTNGGPLISIDRVVDRVAAALDIGRNTVSRITKEKFGETGMEDNKLTTPSKKRRRNASITDLDSFDIDAIRNHIFSYYDRNEYPTLVKLIKSLKEAELFAGGVTSLRLILNKAGLKWKKVDKKRILI